MGDHLKTSAGQFVSAIDARSAHRRADIDLAAGNKATLRAVTRDTITDKDAAYLSTSVPPSRRPFRRSTSATQTTGRSRPPSPAIRASRQRARDAVDRRHGVGGADDPRPARHHHRRQRRWDGDRGRRAQRAHPRGLGASVVPGGRVAVRSAGRHGRRSGSIRSRRFPLATVRRSAIPRG